MADPDPGTDAVPFDLTEDIVAAVTAHMNGDHAEDNAVICRGVGGRPDTVTATMTGLDLDAIEFTIRTEAADAGAEVVRIPFAAPLVDRPQIRAEVARMFHESNGSVPDH